MKTSQSSGQLTKAIVFAALTVPAIALIAGRAPADTPVTYIAGEQTRAAFDKGQPLVETAAYKVHASRREAPGMAEIHTLDTDIIYVLEGTTAIVTGGKTRDAKPVAPNEIRGSGIDGGVQRRLAKGDVLIVPNGVPHWFTDVQGTFLYYVVKVTAATAAGGAE